MKHKCTKIETQFCLSQFYDPEICPTCPYYDIQNRLGVNITVRRIPCWEQLIYADPDLKVSEVSQKVIMEIDIGENRSISVEYYDSGIIKVLAKNGDTEEGKLLEVGQAAMIRNI